MSSDIFESLLKEKTDIFRTSFSTTSQEVFYDAGKKQIFHAGEYGMYRETVVRDFLKFIVPRSLDISTGFVITPLNDVSTQCDIIIFDAGMTPLYQEGERQRFFPIESIFCIGEVKSTLSKTQLSEALNKMASIKALSERMVRPTIISKSLRGPYDPINNQNDLVPSILVCQKLNFDLSRIEQELDSLYDTSVVHRHKHNMILSIEDGLLSYCGDRNLNMPYSRLNGSDLKHRFSFPDTNNQYHFRYFATYMFMITTNKTPFYPEISNYMLPPEGGFKRDQT